MLEKIKKYIENISIEKKISIGFFTIFLSSFLTTSIIFNLSSFELAKKAKKDYIDNQSSLLIVTLTPYIKGNNIKNIENILKTYKENDKIDTIIVYKNSKEIASYYSNNTKTLIQKIPTADFAKTYAIITDKTEIGEIYIHFDLSSYFYYYFNNSNIILILLLFVFLSGLFFIRKIKEKIVIPIKTLTDASRHILDHNDFNISIAKTSNDEIGLLTDTFNKLVNQIRSNEYKMMYEAEILENKIKERTKTINEQRLKAEELKEELQNYIFIFHHDLRTPLINLESFSSIIEENLKELEPNCIGLNGNNESFKEIYFSINVLHENVYYIKEMFQSILNFTKINNATITKIVFKPKTVIEEIKNNNNINFPLSLVGIPDEIESSKDVFVNIMQLLIHNAYKYLKKDEPQYIEIGYYEKEDSMFFYVKDNGIGIPEIEQKKIFELFRKGRHSDKTSLGMGLPYAKAWAKRINGDITVVSKEKVGSTFTVKI